MSKTAQLELNSRQFKRQIARFARDHNVMFRDVMYDQMRLYCLDLSRRFPPSKKLFSRSEFAAIKTATGAKSERRLGERAVEIGIKSTIYPMSPDELAWANEFGISALKGMAAGKRMLKRKDGTVWLVDAQIYKPNASPAELEKWHNRHRSTVTGKTSREGKMHQWDRTIGRWKERRILHTTPSALSAYIKRKKKDVGKLKGGWVAGIMRFGGKLPAKWISRHASGMAGGAISQSGNGVLWATNTVPYASRYKRVQQFALVVRRKDLARQAKKRLRQLVSVENRRKAS